MEITRETLIADLAVARPGTIRVFQKHGLDFCCGGQRPLGEACAEKGLAFDVLRADLAAAEAPAADDGFDWSRAPLDVVVSRIVDRYHVWLRAEMPRLQQMADKVRQVHGSRHPEVVDVASLLVDLANDLRPHMMKEEQMLFPYVARLAQADREGTPMAPSPFGTVDNPIHVMEAEHEAVGDLLKALRRFTKDFASPADACNTFRGLYLGLEELERELHEHIHVENNVLHPRARQLERALAGRAFAHR